MGHIALCVVAPLLGLHHVIAVSTDDEYIVMSKFYSNGSLSHGTPVIRIGTPLTLDKGLRHSESARHMQQGYELYFQWLNAERGGIRINGSYHPVELVLVNDFSSEALAKEAAEVLVNNYQVRLFLGPFGSQLSEAVAYVVEQSGSTMLAPAASRASIVSGRQQVFSMDSSPTSAEIALSALSQQTPRPTLVAFLQEEGAYPEICDALVTLTAQYSMQIVFNATLSPMWGSTTNASQISAVVSSMGIASPDIVIGCTYQTLCEGIVREAGKQDWNPKALIFTSCNTSSTFVEKAFVLGTTSWNQLQPGVCDLTGMNTSEFSELYRARFEEPVAVGAAAFAASAVIVHAVELANSTDPSLVANALRKMNVSTIHGRVEFDTDGMNMNGLKMIEYGLGGQAGQTKIVAPPSSASEKLTYPKPTWFDLKCLDPDGGLTKHGYPKGNSQIDTCGDCSVGEAGTNTIISDGSSRRICEQCPIGKVLQVVGDTVSCETCSQGYFWCGQPWNPPVYGAWVSSLEKESNLCQTSSSVPSSCLTCPRGRYQDEFGQTSCKECTPGRYMNELGETQCRACNSIERGGAVRQTFSAHNASIACTECPEGAICEPDGDGLYSGYTNADEYFLVAEIRYNTDNSLGELHKCPNGDGEACLARGNCYRDPDTGEVAMEGMFCGNCRAGFAQGEIGNVCTKCPPAHEAYFSHFTSQVLVFCLSLALSINQILKDPKTIPPTSSVILRQFLNYVQLSTVVLPATQLSDTGDEIVSNTKFLQFLMAARGTQSSSKGTECFLKFLLPDLKIFESYTLAGLCMVPIWLLIDLLFFFIFKGIASIGGFPKPGYAQLATGITLNLFIVQPRLTQIFLIPFRCKFLDSTRLTMHLDAECDSMTVVAWQAVAFFGLVFLPIGIPLALMGVLWHLKAKRKLFSVSSVQMFGFVFQGLRPEYYYFECVNMIRKVVFQLAANVPWLSPDGSNESLEKALVCTSLMIVCIIFLGLHLRCRPYDSRNFNILHKIEASILWALLVTCLAQAWRYVSDAAWVFSRSSNQAHNRSLRDALCTITVLLFHLRCIWLMFFGIFSTYLRKQRWYVLWFGGDVDVTVDTNGVHVARLSNTARNVLVDAITNTTLQQLRSESLDYEVWNDAMRRICVEALYDQDRHEFSRKHPLTAFAMKIKEMLYVKPEFLEAYVTRNTSRKGLDDWVLDPHYQHNPDHIDEAAKRTFGVADLQMEAIRLNWQEDARPISKRSKRSQGIGFLKRLNSSLVGFSSQKIHQDPDKGDPSMSTPTVASPIPVFTPPPAQVFTFGPERVQKAKVERDSLLRLLQCKEDELAALKKMAGEEHVRLPTPGFPTSSEETSPRTEEMEEPAIVHGDAQETHNENVRLLPRLSSPRSGHSDESV